MKIEIGEGRVTVSEGSDRLSVAELTGKVQAGLLYSTPIGEGEARFVKSPTAKMIYSLEGDTLPEQYLDGVDVVVTIEGSLLAKQASDHSIEVETMQLNLEQFTPGILAVMSDGALINLHDKVHGVTDTKRSAEAHVLLYAEMEKRGMEHAREDDLDDLFKTILDPNELPNRVMLAENYIAAQGSGIEDPSGLLLTVKPLNSDDLAKVLEYLPEAQIDFEPAGPLAKPLYDLVLERTRAEEPNSNIEAWQCLSLPVPVIEKVSDKPWGDFSEGDYSDANNYCAACLIDMNTGEKVKGMCKLPVKEPGGALNRNAVHAAASRFNAVDAPPDVKSTAARKLVSLYNQLGETPPSSVSDLAKDAEITFNARIIKVDEEQRMVYGVVMEPDTIDTQGDFATAEEIEKAAHDYLETKQKLGFMHRLFNFGNNLRIMESFISQVDFVYNGETVKKGSWVMSVRILADDVWQKVKDGLITGFSIGGTGKRL